MKKSPESPKPAVAPPASFEPHNFTNGGDEVLIVRRTGQDRKSHNGFTYPAGVGSGVSAPDWSTVAKCGGGLHGWPWSFGLGEGQDFEPNDLWIVMGAKAADVVGNLEGGWKCKCKSAVIRFEGNMKGAMDFVRDGFTACVRNMEAGDSATNASSGNFAKNASSGNSATNEAKGPDSTCACAGVNGYAKVGARGAFALAYRDDDGPHFLCGKVGEKGIKADTWYHVVDGKIAAL